MTKTKNLNMETLFSFTTKETAKEFLINKDLNLLTLVALKKEARLRFSEECTDMPPYHALVEVISISHNTEIQNIKADFESKISEIDPIDASIEIDKLLNNYTKNEHITRMEANISHFSSKIIMDSWGEPIEPLAFYSEICQYLLQIKYYFNYIIKRNNTPIKNRIKDSLSDFLLLDWKKKVEQEAQDSQKYYQSILFALKQIQQNCLEKNQSLTFPVNHNFRKQIIGHNDLREILPWIESKIKKKRAPQSPGNDNAHFSFSFIKECSKPELIETLFTKLKYQGLIALDTHLPDFRKIWMGLPITKKIIWLGTPAELAFFIRHLISHLKILEKLPNNAHWETTIQCFHLPKFEELKPKQLRNSKKTTSSEKIEKICLFLKHHSKNSESKVQ